VGNVETSGRRNRSTLTSSAVLLGLDRNHHAEGLLPSAAELRGINASPGPWRTRKPKSRQGRAQEDFEVTEDGRSRAGVVGAWKAHPFEYDPCPSGSP
jgi:hypothetical protein